MKKFVDIIPKSPVQLGNHIQRLRSNRVWLDVDDIRTAIVHKAIVIEHTVYGDVNQYDRDPGFSLEGNDNHQKQQRFATQSESKCCGTHGS